MLKEKKQILEKLVKYETIAMTVSFIQENDF